MGITYTISEICVGASIPESREDHLFLSQQREGQAEGHTLSEILVCVSILMVQDDHLFLFQ